jgi:hypothetical protein
MNIYPQDLRDRQHAYIISRRAYSGAGMGDAQTTGVAPSNEPPTPHMGRLGRLWARGSGLSDAQAAAALPASAMVTQSVAWLPPTLGGFLTATVALVLAKKGIIPPGEGWMVWSAATAALSYLSAVPWARAAFRGLYRRPLSIAEIDQLLASSAAAGSELERAHLLLVRDAIQQPVPNGVTEELRAAIHALGETVDRLPPIATVPLDTDALRHEADLLRAQAMAETDRVISDSLERRADALERRAEANQRSALVGRRSTALRAEIQAQIDALREGLAAFHTGEADTASLRAASDAARSVAGEASAVAAAHAELDSSAVLPATPTHQVTVTASDGASREAVHTLAAGRNDG